MRSWYFPWVAFSQSNKFHRSESVYEYFTHQLLFSFFPLRFIILLVRNYHTFGWNTDSIFSLDHF